MLCRQWLIILVLALTGVVQMVGQTPVSNRVEAVASRLSKDARIAARYPDRQRHCVYFVENNRLYRFDVFRDKCEEIRFTKGYLKIRDTHVAQQGRVLFVTVDRGTLCNNYATDGQALYLIDTFTQKMKEIAAGFDISRGNAKNQPCFTVKKAHQCIDPSRQRWNAKNHCYDMSGSILSLSDTYTVRIEKKR